MPDTDGNSSGADVPVPETSNAEMRRVIEEMFTRQQQMENELASTRAALNSAESGRRVEKSGPEA